MKKFLLTFVVITVMLLLAGCGADLKVNTKVNPDLSGERTFVIAVSENDLKEINLSSGNFEEILRKNMPVPMDIKIESNNGYLVYKLTEKFKNPDELVSNSEKILGYKPDIELSSLGRMLSFQYHFYDPTPPEKYFNWVVNSLEKSGVNLDEYKDSLVASAVSSVKLPGKTDTVADGEYESVFELPANQEAWITWDRYQKRVSLDVNVNLSPVAYEAVSSKVDFKDVLKKIFNTDFTVKPLPDGGMSYSGGMHTGKNLESLTRTPLFSNGKVEYIAGRGLGLRVTDKIIIEGNPTEYLKTKDIDSVTTFTFDNALNIKNVKLTTDPCIANASVKVVNNIVTVHLGDQTNMRLELEVEYYNHLYLVILIIIAILIAVSFILKALSIEEEGKNNEGTKE